MEKILKIAIVTVITIAVVCAVFFAALHIIAYNIFFGTIDKETKIIAASDGT